MERWTIIIFGMSGDLAKRQIIPALYELFHTSTDQEKFTIIGIALDATTIEAIIEQARPFIEHADEETLGAFKARCTYYQLTIGDQKVFETLAQNSALSNNRIAYLAVAADYFCTLTTALTKHKVIEPGNTRHRIVYEKPFGTDGASAQKINACIAPQVSEEQIYRIDHYLTKELVSNILLMRLSNTIFEAVWNKQYIDHVEIILDESLGLEGRGAYYDQYGALKDVVQNHMLQMLALIAMEQPTTNNYHDVQQQKVAILKQISVTECVLGQYAGYQQEPHVKPDSTTETFVATKLNINTPRWHGVPFYIRTGKRLHAKSTAIHITFKTVTQCFIKAANSCLPNVLTITMAPEEGFRLRLNAKKPYSRDEVGPAYMDFCYSCLYGPETPQAYVVLLQDIIAGDHTITVSAEEIACQWQVIEKIQALHPHVQIYQPGSAGPQEALDLLPKERK